MRTTGPDDRPRALERRAHRDGSRVTATSRNGAKTDVSRLSPPLGDVARSSGSRPASGMTSPRLSTPGAGRWPSMFRTARAIPVPGGRDPRAAADRILGPDRLARSGVVHGRRPRHGPQAPLIAVHQQPQRSAIG